MSITTAKKKNRTVFVVGKVFLLSMLLLCTPSVLFAINASDVATIDMQLVFNLHPKMALFDFNRIGFYKVKYGLNYDDFVKETKNLKANPKDNSAEIKKLEDELEKIISEASDYHMKNGFEVNKKDTFSERINDLRQKIEDLKWESANGDLTSKNETKVIKAEILKEIYGAIEEVVKEKKYTLVLNTAIIAPYKYNYKSVQLVAYQGIPSVNLDVYNAFELIREQIKFDNSNETNSAKKRWLELTKIKDNKLPFTAYPMVLSGGSSINSDVVAKIYKKYNIHLNILKTVCSLIERIETLQRGKEIEKLEVIDENQ